MQNQMMINIPTLVRIKPNAIDRIGIYLSRHKFKNVLLLISSGLPESITQRTEQSLRENGICYTKNEVNDNSMEKALETFTNSNTAKAIIGLGGGKALDVAKYVSFLERKPYFSIPTSLSNDGFCSPQSSLTVKGKRKSLPSAMPYGVVVDTQICLEAPEILWLSGVGDLSSKLTAVADWKLAFHDVGEPVNDFAALLSDATVYQFIGCPERDIDGIKLLATALMLNGIAMAVCGTSRPASGGEHLISHALDSLSKRPRLHGLQVGMATYLTSHLQRAEENPQTLRQLFNQTGFFKAISNDPFSKDEWQQAINLAPSVKENFHTCLSKHDAKEKLLSIIETDSSIQNCFI